MDGNGRWAAQRRLPPEAGHEAGVAALIRTVDLCLDWGIPALSVFALSTENWRRGDREVALLLALFEHSLAAQLASLKAKRVALRFVGDRGPLPASLAALMARAEAATADPSPALNLMVAVSYGGRQDIAAAARAIAAAAQAGALSPEDIDECTFGQYLSTAAAVAAAGEPDLLIRTSSEQRLSNFMLFEAAYAELWFSKELWPDFGERPLVQALAEYATRQRRFGQRPQS